MYKKITLFAFLFFIAVSFSQTVSTVTDGNFYDGIGQDSHGNIYCSDFFGDSVYKYDTNGNVTTFKNGFTNPNGVDVNEQDEIFICENGASTIHKYDTNGSLITSYTSGVNGPTGIRTITGTTNMLFVEYGNNTLKRLEQDGTVTTLFSGFPLNGPSGIAFINGETYISNFNDRKIMRFENNMMIMITQLPADGPNNNFLGFLSASNSQLFATQWGAHKIYSIDPTTGNTSVYAGSTNGITDGDISVAQFSFPNGIYADVENNILYVSEAGTNNLRIIENAALSIDRFNSNLIDLKLITNNQNDTLKITANLNSNKNISIKLFEITGKEVLKRNYTNTNTSFNETIGIENLSSGIYVLLFSQEGQIISRKIII